MKASLIRALLLSLSLLVALPPQFIEARGAGGGGNGKRDDDRNRGQNQGAARPNAPGGNANNKGGGARNPLTGSSVSGGGNNRPNNNNNNNNRPGGGGGGGNNNQNKRPDNKPNQPAARPTPLPPPVPSNRPTTLPAGPGMTKPAPQPNTPNRPGGGGGGGGGNNNNNRPGGGNDNRPGGNNNNRPGGNNNNDNNRPGGNNNNDNRPGNNDNRPNPRPPQHANNNRPNQNNRPGNDRRPNFVPGKVVYPNHVTKPANRPNNNININNSNNINKVGNNNNNRRPHHPAHYTNRSRPKNVSQITTNTNINQNWGNQWNNNSTTIWNNNRVVNNRPVTINANFQNSQNYAYRPSSWGSRPWWSSSTYHTWHHGSWNYGWNNTWQNYHGYNRRPAYRPPVNYFPGYRPAPGYYYDDHDDFDAGKVAAWGLAAWGLGSLIYDTGYSSYRNPYQAPPVQTTQQTIINYSQPLSVVASREVPQEQAAALTATEKSSAAIERARAEFKNGDYLASLKSTDESISFAPGDSALHEFRALNLFALGRYGDAAGVLNPLLASGPGWDWATMSDFYPSSDAYSAQLRKLEAYVEGSPGSADAHFVLGYHYLVAGFIDEAYQMFDRVVTLQPADSVAVQLRNLAESSSSNAAGDPVDPAMAEAAQPTDPNVVVEPIDPTDIEGGWKAPAADGKSITLTLGADGNFTWNYDGATDGKVLSGEWSIDEQGQLVLASSDVQMVADVSLDGDTLQFILAGSPVGDPGLTFQRL
jgi:tetratricopeptide (TPR) repeat protein